MRSKAVSTLVVFMLSRTAQAQAIQSAKRAEPTDTTVCRILEDPGFLQQQIGTSAWLPQHQFRIFHPAQRIMLRRHLVRSSRWFRAWWPTNDCPGTRCRRKTGLRCPPGASNSRQTDSRCEFCDIRELFEAIDIRSTLGSLRARLPSLPNNGNLHWPNRRRVKRNSRRTLEEISFRAFGSQRIWPDGAL
jgi:hypothetical protein